ncbi:SDR family NAD(P)-dependent oxidoreductase [Brackiella oedipodis]|uniref:SDR family NAD(P)-dependent oxidoreductase n=1 Tax=Brackiella oedipodis TaxID=124225 RepID=UPI00048F489F|nr:SDR family NAD(P)-dependent oxidoreductase [Brackiella oedipodis]
MSKLQDKVAIISGSGRGIGRAIALKLASEGAKVVVNDLDPDYANQVLQEIREAGGQAVACNGDVTAADFAERFVQTAMDEYGALDIIINNAGYTWDNVIQKMSDEQWYAIIDCHLTAPFRILRAAQPIFKQQALADAQAGKHIQRKVVNISSTSGVFGNAGQVNYAAAKAGILGLTKTLAKEWGRYHVNVNAVAFGLIKTRLTGDLNAGETANIDGKEIKLGVRSNTLAMYETVIPLGRGGSAEEAANAVYLMCIPESDYVSGHTVLCTGGLTGGM